MFIRYFLLLSWLRLFSWYLTKINFRKTDAANTDAKNKRRNKRAFQRRSSEVEVRVHGTSFSGAQIHSSSDGPKSPTVPSRRRSSSIAVARPTPDLHRYSKLQSWYWIYTYVSLSLLPTQLHISFVVLFILSLSLASPAVSILDFCKVDWMLSTNLFHPKLIFSYNISFSKFYSYILRSTIFYLCSIFI